MSFFLFKKSLLNLLQYCFCFTFWFFGHKACGILASWPGSEPSPPALQGKILTTGLPRKSPNPWALKSRELSLAYMRKRQKGKSVKFETGEGFDPDVGTPRAATMGRLAEPRKQSIQSCECKKLDLANNLDKPPWRSSSGQTGFPGGSDSKEICLQCRRLRFRLWVGKTPWRRQWQPTPVFLPGEFHGLRSLGVYSPWGHKESDMIERLTLCFHLILRDPWAEEPAESTWALTYRNCALLSC